MQIVVAYVLIDGRASYRDISLDEKWKQSRNSPCNLIWTANLFDIRLPYVHSTTRGGEPSRAHFYFG